LKNILLPDKDKNFWFKFPCPPAALKSSLYEQIIAPAGILFGTTNKQAAKQQQNEME
jgi:hypothetical protein